MSNQLLSPVPVKREDAAEVWADMIDAGEALLRAGFARKFGPENVEQAYREWWERQIAEHDRELEHLLSELSRRESRRAG